MSQCPICQVYGPPDPETGYDAPDICLTCAAEGWTYDRHGVLINEHEPLPDAFDEVRR